MFEKIAQLFNSFRKKEDKICIGDKVLFKSGRYYVDSYGNKPYGYRNRGKEVYVTRINRCGSHPYHVSTGESIGNGDLGWLTEEQIEKVVE